MVLAAILLLTLNSQFSIGSDSAAQSEEMPLINIIYFSAASCNDCLEVKQALPKLIADLEEYISIEEYDIEKEDNLEKFLLYEEKYEIGNVAPPVMFIGEHILIGAKTIIDKFEQTIIDEITNILAPPTTEEEPNTPQKTKVTEEPNLPPQDNTEPESRITKQFNKFSIGAVALAGLLDGINPCAFTTIVFFVSMLAYLGKSKYQLIVVGVGFTVAVFVTYLLLGLGLLGVTKSFLVSRGITQIVTYTIALLTFILAGWSFLDFIRFIKTKSAKSMTLGLPKSVKSKIHKVIKVGLGTRGLLIGSISVGFMIAILESICTGQIYLPVIVFVAKSSERRMDAIFYLLLYNLMFIIPLVIVLIITFFGVKSETMGNFFGRHLALSKLIMTLLFLSLGIILLLT